MKLRFIIFKLILSLFHLQLRLFYNCLFLEVPVSPLQTPKVTVR